MEIENKDTPLASSEVSQPTQESTLPVAEGSQQVTPKNDSKIPKAAIYILATIILLTLGAFGLWFYQKRASPSLAPSVSTIPTLRLSPSIKPEPSILTDWKTYRSEKYAFEFKYPKEWSIKEAATEVINIYDETNALIVSISSVDLTIIGVSYCGANPQDGPRCETLEVNGIPIGIDWGINGTANAMISISNEVGLSLTLHQVNSQTKLLFRQILSTFKFID